VGFCAKVNPWFAFFGWGLSLLRPPHEPIVRIGDTRGQERIIHVLKQVEVLLHLWEHQHDIVKFDLPLFFTECDKPLNGHCFVYSPWRMDRGFLYG